MVVELLSAALLGCSDSSLHLVLGLPANVLISNPVGLMLDSTELAEFCSKP